LKVWFTRNLSFLECRTDMEVDRRRDKRVGERRGRGLS
jgi:hypothetical protein